MDSALERVFQLAHTLVLSEIHNPISSNVKVPIQPRHHRHNEYADRYVIYVMWITNSIKKNIFNIISLYSIYPTTIQVQDSPQTLLVTNYGNSLTSTVTFTYDSSLTPLLNSVSPSSGSGGIITLTGFGMAGINASVVSVSIGKANCLVIYYLNFYFYLFIWIVIKIYIDLSFILKLC